MAPSVLTPPPTSLPGIVIPQRAAPPQSLINRSQRFLEENWVPVLVCTALAVGGVAYYYTRQDDIDGDASGSGTGTGTREKDKKDKKSKKGKKRASRTLSGEGTEGPLLEELPQDVSGVPLDRTAQGRLADIEVVGAEGSCDGWGGGEGGAEKTGRNIAPQWFVLMITGVALAERISDVPDSDGIAEMTEPVRRSEQVSHIKLITYRLETRLE